MSNCSISSTNSTAVINGAGTLKYANLAFPSTGSNITATTQIPLITSNNALKVVIPGAYPYTIITQDALIPVDTSVARTVNLPASPSSGEQHTVKDNTNGALVNNITVSGNGNNIDGIASQAIITNGGALTVAFNGTQWNVTSRV